MHVMVVNLWRAKKGLPKFYFRQPLGNPTYSSPNLVTLVDGVLHLCVMSGVLGRGLSS